MAQQEGNGTASGQGTTTTVVPINGNEYTLRLLGVGQLYEVFEQRVLRRAQDEARNLAGPDASPTTIAETYKTLRPSSIDLSQSVWEEMATLPGAVRILVEAAAPEDREQLERDALAEPVMAVNAAQYIAGATDEHPLVEQKKSSSSTTRRRTRKPSRK